MNPIEKLQAFLPDPATAALITSEVNARYFTAFSYTDGAVLITKDAVYLLCDFRYIEAAEKHASSAVSVIQFKKLDETINDTILRKNIKSIMKIVPKPIPIIEIVNQSVETLVISSIGMVVIMVHFSWFAICE